MTPGLGIPSAGKRWGTVRGCFGSEPMRREDKLERKQREGSEGTRNSSLQSLGDLGKEMGRWGEKADFLGKTTHLVFYTQV